MSLLDRLIWGPEREDFETFSRIPSPSSPSSPLDPELARRVEAFRRQLAGWTAPTVLPLLILPETPEPQQGQCVSCGESAPEGWRCALCLRAVHLALGMTTEEGT